MTINQIIIQVIISLISGLTGALLGAWVSFKIKSDELKLYEKATALSIAEELKVLLDEYQSDFDESYSKLDGKIYLEMQYSITQDFTTVYSQNAGEIGLIKNKELRNLIIKSYTILKKYMEELLIYTNDYNEFEKSRNEFISRAYPYSINTACAKANNHQEIKRIKECVNIQDWTWLNSPFLNQMQVITFISSDNKKIEDLINYSEELNKIYNN